MKSVKKIVYLVIILSSCLIACHKDAEISLKMDEHFFMRSGGSDMPVWVHGNGMSNVFIVTMHGGPGIGYGLDFRRGVYAETLEEKYAMVYWDQRHQGGSHGHLESDEISVAHIIDDIHFLLQTLRKRYGDDISLFLMGHSWGGTASTAFLLKENYQQELKGWINIAGTPDIAGEGNATTKRVLELANEYIGNGESVAEWQKILEEVSTIDTNIVPLKKEDADKIFQQEKKAFALLENKVNKPQYRQGGINSLWFSPAPPPLVILGNTAHLVFKSFWDEVQTISLIDDLHKIEIPTMLVFGKYDLGAPPSSGKLIYDNINSSEKALHIYEYSEHEPFGTEPELFSQDLIDFVELHK